MPAKKKGGRKRKVAVGAGFFSKLGSLAKKAFNVANNAAKETKFLSNAVSQVSPAAAAGLKSVGYGRKRRRA